jgi:hypothetical protein
VFDFKVDREAEELLINGYALKLIPQRVRKLSLLAAVISPNEPGLPVTIGAIQAPEVVSALKKLERNGLVTADVGLSVMYTDNTRDIVIRVRVVEVEGKDVIHKDLLLTRVALPLRSGHVVDHDHIVGVHHSHPAGPGHPPPMPSCSPSDWKCHISTLINAVTPGRGPCRRPGHGGERHPPSRADGKEWDRQPEISDGHHRHHGHPGQYHRHRFGLHRPRHGFMRFVISVVIPVIIGAAVGVGIGILSVFVAEIAGGVIMRLRGRREREYAIVEEDEGEELPKYVEVVEVECVDEKQ